MSGFKCTVDHNTLWFPKNFHFLSTAALHPSEAEGKCKISWHITDRTEMGSI